jgi:hypothetical protein
MPHISGKADGTLGSSKNAKTRGGVTLWKSPLTALCALFIVLSSAMAAAQTTTTTTLAVTPSTAANGSVFKMTATVKAGATSLTAGTVTFRDTYNSVTQVLGTVQVQSGNGTKGTAILHQQLGGIGTHSIVATFNAPKTFSNSVSTTQSVTTNGLYPTTASLAQTGGSAGNWSLTTTIVGIGSLNFSPTGNVSLLDTSNSNLLLGVAGLGAGTFGQKTVAGSTSPVAVGNNPLDLVAGDFNNNGSIDLVVLNSTDNTTSILNGNGAGGFTASGTTRTTGNGPVAIVAGDFDGDGNLDFAVANSTDKTVWVRLGNGDGTFGNHATYSVSLLTITSIAVGDFNGDGIPDLAVVGTTATGGAVDILQGDGTGAFNNVTPSGIAVGNGPSSIVTGDFNGDGNLDFAVANQTDNTVSVMRGNGSGTTFTAAIGSPFNTGTGTSPAAIAVADFNGDGQLDLAIVENGKKRVDIFKGNGDATFSLLAGAPTTGNNPVSIVAGDFNADGKVDFAVTNKSDNNVTIMLGNGSGTAFTAGTSSPFATGTTPVALATADFNGDGSADLGVANSGSKNISILLNQVTDTASILMTGISIPGSGNHNVEASYPGDASFNASISGKVSLAATQITTSTLLSANTTTPSFGQQVVLTATVQSSPVGGLTPGGTVTFKDSGVTIQTVSVSGGVAVLNTTSLTVGTHSITATYSGDTNFANSASPALGVIVSKTTPVITWANPSPITYWTLLSSTQLNATTTAPGTFAYSQPLYTLLPVGTYTITATFTPTDPTGYTMATASVTLDVNPAVPQINWPSPGPISFGTPLSGIQLDATVSVYNMVPLAPFYNVTGIYTDGSTFGVPPGGFDGTGAAYSSNLLGTSVTWNNITYPLGPTNAPDAVANTTITLPAGHYASINLLGALVNGNVTTASTFVVTYTDNTTVSVTQHLSDWVFPLNYTGESVLTCVPYRNNSNGSKDAHLTCVFGYQIPLDSTKIVQSITLPPTRNNVFLAMALVSPPVPGTLVYTPPSGTVLPTGANTLSAVFTPTDTADYTGATASVLELVNPANTVNIVWPTPAPITYGTALSSTQLNAVAQTIPGTTSVSLSPYYRVNAFQTDGSLFSTGGFDNNGNAFSSNQVGSSIVWNGTTYSLGTPNLPNAVTSTTIALPQGNFTQMTLIGAATTTGQINQNFTLTYTDGTSVTGGYSVSSWTQPQNYPGETIVSTTPYQNTGSGGRTNGNVNLYGYQILIDSSKVVQSLILPNNRNVVLMAMSLSTATTPTTIPGTYTYTPPAGTVPAVGTVPLSVLFTATDPNFGTATKTVNLLVTKASLLVTANNQTVPYGTALAPYTATITGFVNGDTQATATSGTPSLTTTPATPVNPGAYTITTAAGSLTSSANYSLTYANGLVTITKPTLTVTAGDTSRAYGAANPTFTASAAGAVNGDTFTFTESTSATTASPVGTYSIVPVATGAHLSNYNVVYVNGTLTVNKAILVVTAANQTAVYGAALAPYTATITGFVNGDTQATATSGTPSLTTTPATPTAAGAYTITAAQGTLASSKYTFTFATGTLTITKAPLIVTAANASRAYGAANPTFSASAAGAVNGDTFTFTETTSATPASPIGNYSIVPLAAGTNLGNYTVVYNNGTLTVTRATLIVTANNQGAVYGAAIAPYTATITGFVNSDTQATATTGTPSLTTSPTTPINVGAYTITAALGTLVSSNYTFTFATGTLTITKAALIVTANNQTAVYGAALAPYTATITGFVHGDTQATATTGTPSLTTSPAIPTAAGAYTITAAQGALTASNYTFTFATGTLTITKAALIVTANNQTAVYGAALASYTATITGFVSGDTQATATTGTPSLTTSPTTPTAAGTYTITAAQGTLAASNYTFTFATGTLTITKATLIVTANNQTAVYGAALAPYTATITGFVGGDTQATATTGTPSLTTSPTTPTAAGAYTITAAVGTLASSNYTFTFTTGTLTITKANLIVTANNQTAVYGATLAPYTAIITGFVSGDTQATATTGTPSLTTSPATPTAVGPYTITAAQGTLVSSN